MIKDWVIRQRELAKTDQVLEKDAGNMWPEDILPFCIAYGRETVCRYMNETVMNIG
jgi:hypothetical protein